MEFKGTKGEWKKDIGIDEDANGLYQNIVYTDLSISPAFAFGCTIEEAEANAKLIAAAPELLEALQDALLSLKVMEKIYTLDKRRIERAEKVINKALAL